MEQPIVIDTPEGIHYAALASEKARVKMEKVGLKGKGGSARLRVIKYFKMKRNATHDEVIARLQKEMDDILAGRTGSAT